MATLGVAAISSALVLTASAHAAPRQTALAAQTPAGTSGFRVQSIVQVPHSSAVWAILVSGSQDNWKWRIVRKSGHHWTKVKVPKLGGRYGSLSSLGAANAKTLYLSGAYQFNGINEIPALWHWNGHSFARVSLPPMTNGAESAGQISFSSPTNAWVSGGIWDAADNQSALHLVGKKWTLVEHPPDTTVDEGFISIAAVSPSFAWAVNGDSSVQYWNGTTWAYGPAVPAGMQPFAVAADKKASYLVGEPPYPTRAHAIVAKWSGKAWVKQKLPKMPRAGLSSVAISGKSVWALGEHDGGNAIFEPVVLHSNGGGWTYQKVKGSNHLVPGAPVTAYSPTRAWFGGDVLEPKADSSKSFIAFGNAHKWTAIPSKT